MSRFGPVSLLALAALALFSLPGSRCGGGGQQKTVFVRVGLPAGVSGVGSAGFEIEVPAGANVLLNNTALVEAGAGGIATDDTLGAWNLLDDGTKVKVAFLDPLGLDGAGAVIQFMVRVPATLPSTCDAFPLSSSTLTDPLAAPLPGASVACIGVFE